MNQTLSPDTQKRIQKHIVNLASSDENVSYKAERHLQRFGSKALPQLIEAASHTNPQVRFRSVWALGKSKDARALCTIVERTRDLDERVSYDAVMALGELGDLRAVPMLMELAADLAQGSILASAAAMALARLGIELPKEPDSTSV